MYNTRPRRFNWKTTTLAIIAFTALLATGCNSPKDANIQAACRTPDPVCWSPHSSHRCPFVTTHVTGTVVEALPHGLPTTEVEPAPS